MRHTSQENLKINKKKTLIINGNIKKAIAYTKSTGISALEFGKIVKKLKITIWKKTLTYPMIFDGNWKNLHCKKKKNLKNERGKRKNKCIEFVWWY